MPKKSNFFNYTYIYVCYLIWNKKKEGCGKQDRNCLQWHCKPIERDVAQLGSAFVLGTKCHGFKSCLRNIFFSTNVSLILLTIINTYLLGREAKITIFPGQLYRIFDLFESISIWADSGNRTRVFSLAKRNFTIRLYPHFFAFLIRNLWIIFVQSYTRYTLWFGVIW